MATQRPTDTGVPRVNPSEEPTTQTPAVSDDPLGPGRLEAGRSEPSSPNAVIGPVTSRRKRTAPYVGGERGGERSPPPDKAQRPKKSLPRRILKGLLWTLAILLLLIGAAIAFFHTGPGKDVARGIAEGALSKNYDGKVTIGELDYALGGDLEIKDLVIAQNDGREVVHLGNLLVDLDWGSLLSKPLTIEKLAIDGLKLDLVNFADGTNNLKRMQKKETKLPEQIVVQAIDIKNVNATVEQPNGDKIVAKDIEVLAALAMDGPAGTLDLGLTRLAGHVDTPKLAARFDLAAKARKDGANIEASLEPKSLSVTPKALGDKAMDVVIRPVTVSLVDGVADMRFGGIEAGPVKIAAMRTLGRLPSPGAVGQLGPGEHLLELTGLHLEKSGLNALLGRELLLSDVSVDASVKGPPDKLVVDGKVATAGGHLDLTGTVDAHDLKRPVVHLELTGTDLDTTKVLAGEARPDVQTSFKGVIDLTGLPPDHELTFRGDIGKTTVRGRSIDSVTINAHGKGQVLQLDGLVVQAFGQSLTLDGQFDQGTRDFRGSLRMKSALGDAIGKAREAGVLVTPLPPIEGVVDVDLGVSGRLKATPPPTPGVETPPATPFDPKTLIVNGRLDFSKLPIETLVLEGHIDGNDVVVKALPGTNLPDKKVGEVEVLVDLAVEGGKPDGLKGRLDAKVGGLDTGTTTLDAGEVHVVLDGLTQDITVKARDERQALALELAMKSVLDLERRHVDTTISRLDAKRGPAQTRLEAPVTLSIDQGTDGGQAIKVPPMKLALAGGTLDVAVAAKLSKDEANPGANKVDHFDLSLDLDGVDVGRLAALARRSTRGLSGKLDASVRAQGTRENPQLDFFGSLRGRMKTADPFTAKFEGALRDKKLDLALEVLEKGARTPLLSFDLMAPLNLPTTPGAKPSLGAGRFAIEGALEETTLARLGALMPNGLPPGVDPEATLALAFDLGGTTAQPTGNWRLAFEGDLLRRRGFDKAPARQKLAVAGSLRPEGGVIALESDLDVHLDAAAEAFVAHHTAATFARSPLLQGFMNKPWTLEAGLERPLDLKVLSDLGLARQPLAGGVTLGVKLRGEGPDVLGTLELLASSVRAGNAPVADVAGLVTIGERDLRITQSVKAAGLEALAVDATVGVPGKGLRTFIKDRARLMAAPLSGEVRLVEHAIAEWRAALAGVAKVPELPGKLGGALALGGDLQTPTATGAFAWDGFDTAAGTPGRVAFELDATPTRAEGGLALGAAREVTIRGGVARKHLLPPAAGKTPEPLPIDLAMKADRVDLLTIVPGFVTAGKPWKVKGTLDWAMAGQLLSSRDPAAPGLLPGSHLVGDLLLSALDVEVPDTDRHLRDGRVAIKATREALEIAAIEIKEGRFPNLPGLLTPNETRGDRFVQITGKVPWTDLKVNEASLSVKTYDWLIAGLGFDGPEGELDLDLQVAAKDLTAPVKSIDVTLARLDVYAPDRFIRAHYPQFPAYDDVVYLEPGGRASGVLPPGKGAPPAPPAANAPPADPNAGMDIRVSIPAPAHIVFAAASPIMLDLQGVMDVKMRGQDMVLEGKIDAVDGELGAMGRPFRLQHGHITADGGLDTFKAELVFAVAPHDIALRDLAEGPHGDLATITLVATAKTGLVTIFGGASGPYLLDMATLLNTGRARLWGMPDVPASETVRFGNLDQGLVLTFIQTNLRNLIFMDRANGWSESLEEPSEYGRLRFFDMQRFIDGSRIQLTAQPLDIGQNEMELGYDWLLVNRPNTVLGFGPHLGTDLRAGLGLRLDWSSAH